MNFNNSHRRIGRYINSQWDVKIAKWWVNNVMYFEFSNYLFSDFFRWEMHHKYGKGMTQATCNRRLRELRTIYQIEKKDDPMIINNHKYKNKWLISYDFLIWLEIKCNNFDKVQRLKKENKIKQAFREAK